tara:strand:+ start:91 stop:552 length:462 start_codon:yes stop_codon:yes gene_type:complete
MSAMLSGVGLETISATVLTIGMGVATPADCYVGIGPQNDNSTIELASPIGSLGCQYDIGGARVFVEHLSSPAKGDDNPGVNHAGVKGLIPVTPDVTLYSGVSIAMPSEQLNGEPVLLSVGGESNGDVRLYGEYLMTLEKPSDGMLHGGVRFVF